MVISLTCMDNGPVGRTCMDIGCKVMRVTGACVRVVDGADMIVERRCEVTGVGIGGLGGQGQ